ncbi:TIGR01777 family oxidoreductase [Nocardioides pocheonensis]|uniref:TIGR01777 family protein n=1 Tax=Nocardioides pocheonensis TaxID=661485 RepID=A0A3N0GQH9_9ACTN|nr:TIGR01777 family oxidoreductase [Nocardioides pocheonensis]RNM14418.1 TIGR01777 family protein [Nocardioides pocheonensis]
MRFLVAGASGFLGSRLRASLLAGGHDVTALVRRAPGPGQAQWDPYSGDLDPALVEQADVVVNLAGSPTLGNPHSRRWAEALRSSRVTTTRVLAEAIAASSRRPAFLAGNGISFYGDHGAEPVTESIDTRGDAFLTAVTIAWQAAAQPAVDAGARVCILRTAPVMDRASAPLRQQLLQFKAGLGGRLGDGRQYLPMISLRDWLGAVTFVAEHDDIAGPVNLCCPQAPTNAEFTTELARLVHRPAVLRVPAAVLRPAAGRMAPELLGSVRAVPQVLIDAGFRFADPTVAGVLASATARG